MLLESANDYRDQAYKKLQERTVIRTDYPELQANHFLFAAQSLNGIHSSA